MNVLSLSNVGYKHRITIDTSAERAMKVYFPKQITKFMELGHRSQGLIPGDNFFFEEHVKATKKVKFNNEDEVMPNKKFPAQSLDNKSMNESIQYVTAVEYNAKSFLKAQEARVKRARKG